MNYLIQAILLIALIISFYTDHKTQKIHNEVTFSLMGVGIIFNIINQGFLEGIKFSFIGIMVAFLSFMIVNIFVKNIGYGDVKLFMGIGACIGFKQALNIFILATFLFLIVHIIFNFKEVIESVKNVYVYGMKMLINKKIETLDFNQSKSKKEAYAGYILIAFIINNILMFNNFNLFEKMFM